jgi:antirestriction protein ArdC
MSRVYEIVTERILKLMEESKSVPWIKPWKSGPALGSTRNLVTDHAYRGINAVLTSFAPTPYFLTFNQAKEIGAHVKKGSVGTPIVYWGRIGNDDDESEKTRLFCKYYTVFNALDVEGLPEKLKAKLEQFTAPIQEETHAKLEAAESIISKTRADIRFDDQARAFYRPHLDYINVPSLGRFNSPEEFYSTVFHELGHWTGHESRLKRPDLMEANYFGSHAYSREELTAELTAAFVCSRLNISTENTERNSAAYLNSWLKALKGDPGMIITASQRAQKAAEYIVNGGLKAPEGKQDESHWNHHSYNSGAESNRSHHGGRPGLLF